MNRDEKVKPIGIGGPIPRAEISVYRFESMGVDCQTNDQDNEDDS